MDDYFYEFYEWERRPCLLRDEEPIGTNWLSTAFSTEIEGFIYLPCKGLSPLNLATIWTKADIISQREYEKLAASEDESEIKYGQAKSSKPERWYRVYDERLEAIEDILQEDVSSLSIRGKPLDPADTWRLSEEDRKKLSTRGMEDAIVEAEKEREQRKQKLKKFFALHYGKLPDEQFLAYLMKYGFDMDYEEMAEFTGKSKEALRKNIWQGKPNLPKSLKSQKKPGRKPKK